jgi:hypothetical protein
MKNRISRKLYRCFLGLHPEPFRIEFGREMLDVFEESMADQGAFFVLMDVICSAIRQQIRYHTAPEPRRANLYWEVARSPELARIFASTVFVLIVAASAGAAKKSKPVEFHIDNPMSRLMFVGAAK